MKFCSTLEELRNEYGDDYLRLIEDYEKIESVFKFYESDEFILSYIKLFIMYMKKIIENDLDLECSIKLAAFYKVLVLRMKYR